MAIREPRDPSPKPPKRNNTDYRPSRAAGKIAKPKPKDVSDKAEYALKNLANSVGNAAKAGGKAIRKVAIGEPKKAMRPAKVYPNKGIAVDGLRKTKEAQSLAREKVRMNKQSAVVSKRKTGEAIKSATKKKIDNKRKYGFYEKPKGK
jgi:hypothetical protein